MTSLEHKENISFQNMHDLVEHREDTCMVISEHDHIRTQGRHVHGHIRVCMASLERREDTCMVVSEHGLIRAEGGHVHVISEHVCPR